MSLIDAPFRISIYGDTDNAFHFGNIAGAGSCYINNSVYAKWEIEGLGTAMSSDALIYTLAGRVGFGWSGKVFPLNTDKPAQLVLFSGAMLSHLAVIIPRSEAPSMQSMSGWEQACKPPLA